MRTTVEDVTNIVETTLDEDIVISIINSANVFVTDRLSGKGLSETILKEIERWLSAHFLAISRERMAQKEGAGGAEITYIGEYGSGFLSTSYGQTAIALDSSGTLNAIAKSKNTATIFAIPSFE